MEIIPFLVGGMNQQQQTIDSLRSDNAVIHQQILDMQTELNNCCQAGHNLRGDNGSTYSNKTENSEFAKARLDQNNPNPFSQSTEIHFYVPETSLNKTIMLFDMQGILLRQIPLNANGESSITIVANELKAGMYLYSLVIDDKEIDTKRMILTN